jgi:transglutaminase-like putative cysteine protease
MLYDISLRISYAYERSAGAGRCLLRLAPASLPGQQRVIASCVNILPRPEERYDMQDFFGNQTTGASFRSKHERIRFEMQCRVDRTGPSVPQDSSPPLDMLGRDIAAVSMLDAMSPHHFLAESPRVRRANAAISEYARDTLEADSTALGAVQTLGLALHRDMRFDAKATHVDTTPEEAFTRRKGVCQDFAHVLISCLRAVGVPAGYVSGYLRTKPPPGKARLEGADAMHAWVQAWCGAKVGWVEYDLTNAIWAGDDHVIVARGRDYSDVAPVKGVLRTAGAQRSKQAVDVKPVDA